MPLDPASTNDIPADYMERVKEIHSHGGHGSVGYGYDWKVMFKCASSIGDQSQTCSNSVELIPLCLTQRDEIDEIEAPSFVVDEEC